MNIFHITPRRDGGTRRQQSELAGWIAIAIFSLVLAALVLGAVFSHANPIWARFIVLGMCGVCSVVVWAACAVSGNRDSD